jgi:hypothetical protein
MFPSWPFVKRKNKNEQIRQYFLEIKQIEARYLELVGKLSFSNPKCLNLNSEKKIFLQKFKQGEVYNPQLEFKTKQNDGRVVAALRRFYEKINLKGDFFYFKEFYKNKIEQLLDNYETIKLWGTPLSGKFVAKAKGRPSWFLFLKAKSFCKNYNGHRLKYKKKLSPTEVGEALAKYVQELSGETLSVVYANYLASKVIIYPKKHLLKINKRAKFNDVELERLKAHEIGVHFMRYHNAKRLGRLIFEIGTANYLETEEGLAVYNEEKNGVLKSSQMFIYAGRVLAAYYAFTKSFYKIFKILVGYGFTKKDAFDITFRAKRNLSDTSLPGGHSKDFVYFSGFHKVKQYSKQHRSKVNDLFLGKFAVEDLPKLEKYLKYIETGEFN